MGALKSASISKSWACIQGSGVRLCSLTREPVVRQGIDKHDGRELDSRDSILFRGKGVEQIDHVCLDGFIKPYENGLI